MVTCVISRQLQMNECELGALVENYVSACRPIRPRTTLSTTNPTWTDLGSFMILYSYRQLQSFCPLAWI